MSVTRLISRLRRGWLRQTALWAMVPLASLNGWPVVGCICSNGTYSSNCPMLSNRASQASARPCCQAGCCAEDGDEPVTTSCCQAQAASPTNSQGSRRDAPTHCSVNHQGCCHLVLQAGELPTLSQTSQTVGEQDAFAFSFAPNWDGVLLPRASRPASFVENDTGPGASDLVITLRRLII